MLRIFAKYAIFLFTFRRRYAILNNVIHAPVAQLDRAMASDSSDYHFDESLQSGLNTGFIVREKKLQTSNDYYLTTKI